MIGLGLALRQRGSFSPKMLFAKGEAGAWYDPADLSSMFQDSAGSVAAAVNAPVGRINDKSGRGNHAVHATATARPMLRTDSGGRLYLDFDGVDDCMRKAFALPQPWERISAFRQNTHVSLDRVFGGVTANAGNLRQEVTAGDLAIISGGVGAVSSLAIGTTGVVSERHAGAASRIAVNNNAPVIGDAGSMAADGISVADAATSVGARNGNVHLYGLCMIGRALSDAETQKLRRFMAPRAGVQL